MQVAAPSARFEIRFGEEVAEARRRGQAVVALESTIISHGLPTPLNYEVAQRLEGVVRKENACPATIAVLDGVPVVGLSDRELERVARDPTFRKLSRRDLPIAMATGTSGATTVSATACLAERAGIRVFATGGLGGVHRNWIDSWDESADLVALSQARITVVSAGVKSILDIPATLQRLETLNIAVVGYRTTEFPGFYVRRSGERVDWSVESVDEIVAAMRSQDALGLRSALLVANPVSEAAQLEPTLHNKALAEALDAATKDAVVGQQITPYLLSYISRATDGASLSANVAAVVGNVELGARIAVAWAATEQMSGEIPSADVGAL